MLEPAISDGQNLRWAPGSRLLFPYFWPLFTLIAAITTVGAAYGGQVVWFEHVTPFVLETSLTQPSEVLRPETPITFSVAGQGVEPRAARLFRRAGGEVGESPVVVRLLPGTEPGGWRLVDLEGNSPLRTDGEYRLSVQFAAPSAALPLPREEIVGREYRFRTVASPRADGPTGTVAPRWGEAVPLTWSMPMQSLAVQSRPAAPVQIRVDEQDPTRTWLEVGGPFGEQAVPGQTYEVLITRARSQDGLELQSPVALKVALPAQPRVLDAPRAPLVLRHGESFTLTTSADLADARVEVDGPLQPTVTVSGNRVHVALPEYQQGVEATLRLVAATSTQGAPLAASGEVKVETPAALPLPELKPADEATHVSTAARPTVAFAVPVADTASAERAISLEPAVSGRWRWTAAQSVEFIPDEPLPNLTDMRLTVRGGPEGPRTMAGGFLEQDVVSSFRTTHFKRIEVDLSEQRLYQLENGSVIRTIVVGTGVAGAETPLGQYEVLYKMSKTRMQGVNPSGKRYDLPDVPWVLPFLGDYAIHGNYWRSTFGSVGSNGCVGMSVEEAKLLYDWADVGTPIFIRQ